MKRIAIFASGNGTNAEAIMSYFKDSKAFQVSLVLSNNSQAYVLNRAQNYNVPTSVFTKTDLGSGVVLTTLKDADIELIVLAGFLLLVPDNIVKAYPLKIINIHPALLPNYGGKGMYGQYVHNAVIKNREMESGITIHYVNQKYDDGDIIFQAKCPVESNDTPETLAERIHTLEHKHYPLIIEKVANQL